MQTLRTTLLSPLRLHHPTYLNRTFLTASKQSLSASRILPYPHKAIYDVISDVASYSQFVPYCKTSTVTTYSTPHPTTAKYYPQEAKLIIGFNDTISEEFWSRVTCIPYSTVEAISGETESTISRGEAPHHTPRATDWARDPTRQGRVLRCLMTKWTLRPFRYKPPPTGAVGVEGAHRNVGETSEVEGQDRTEVNLAVEFQFANPVYGALSGAAAPVVAEKMIEAFERRVKMVVEGPGSVR